MFRPSLNIMSDQSFIPRGSGKLRACLFLIASEKELVDGLRRHHVRGQRHPAGFQQQLRLDRIKFAELNTDLRGNAAGLT